MAHCSLLHQFLCLGFIGANSSSVSSIRRAASSDGCLLLKPEALLMLPSQQALLLLCHLNSDLAIIIYYIYTVVHMTYINLTWGHSFFRVPRTPSSVALARNSNKI